MKNTVADKERRKHPVKMAKKKDKDSADEDGRARPSAPVRMARKIVPGPQKMWGRLIVSLLIDFIGMGGYLVPGLGEISDVVWAPIQTILIMAMYDETSPNLKYLSFIEEILPLTDIIPSATIGWAAQYVVPRIFPKAEAKKD